ncbi:nucleotidyltransferase domain-containing protein [Paractinoplanes rishiriensis]|uniref:Nucleotidyltransferase n=1 Tax=Paractinoplanes rishiriensis TaxID=1050105 RepID=A0A919JTN4_9ACTN|nr:nucleotidyltransferase domain-containing protein [Actinoplanes rishiriensis]GIE93109.1 nucleotidyltransferase [Actinoplanes rishiriensis]
MDAAAAARDLVRARFPDARLTLLAGSTARGTATATSDLDIVVILDGPPAPYRETLRLDGRLVELFVQTPESTRLCWVREAAERRNTLADMCAYGITLTGAEAAAALRDEATAFLAAGAPALTPAELARRRYALTDGLDDLADATDPGERDAIAGIVLVAAAELALLADRRWLGRGKWLVRRLRDHDPAVADRLLAAHRRAVAEGDPGDLTAAADEVLARVGGRLTAGYHAT